MTQKAWAIEEKDFVFESFANGLSASKIGECLGRTKNSVIALFNRERERRGVKALAVKSPEYSKDEIEQARNLWATGLTAQEIANQIGKGRGIEKFLYANKHLFPPRPASKLTAVAERIRNLEKPTPETVVIQYEYKEIPIPEGALSKPFFSTEVGECTWILEDFWTEPKYDSPCCGMAVSDRKGQGLKRTYCQYHYSASLEKVK